MDPGSAWIWDVPSCTLLATIALESDDFGHISCGSKQTLSS
jgi:hypothetical protein